jgi:lysophospholipase L1-like esterase
MKRIVLFLVVIAALPAVSLTQDTHPQACQATAEKTVGSGPLVRMVVFGDSIEWGNGLKESPDQTPGHKFSALVADWLAQTSKHSVQRTVYAHSGATILGDDPTIGQRLLGDVDQHSPTISAQLRCVPEDQRAAVRLILIDGCINDIGSLQLASPKQSPDWVKKTTETSCGAPVEQMLRSAAQMYPRSTILLTGYYPIVSDQSEVGPFLDYLWQYFPGEPKRSASMLTQTDVDKVNQEKKVSAANSRLFYDLSNQLLGNSVDRINTESANKRLYFVKLPFAAENAFGAPASYLWPIPNVAYGFDEVYLQRQKPCLTAFAKDPFRFEVCRLDSAAHPNVEGAKAIANEITKTLTDFAQQLRHEAP